VVVLSLDRAGGSMMLQPRYVASAAQQQPTTAAVAAGYQYYTPVYSQYPSVAVPPPATWIQPTGAATPTMPPTGVTNHYVMPQQLHHIQPAVCLVTFIQ